MVKTTILWKIFQFLIISTLPQIPPPQKYVPITTLITTNSPTQSMDKTRRVDFADHRYDALL